MDFRAEHLSPSDCPNVNWDTVSESFVILSEDYA
jgi:hypothetical protein